MCAFPPTPIMKNTLRISLLLAAVVGLGHVFLRQLPTQVLADLDHARPALATLPAASR